ncbi:excalibur calcium-binding domain-containing protein [Solibacillus sp. FSL H8-0523]|uniref:excalibur calcium-binding domain-containing protein n=1 Tax=Solibacillus sp. FSL H8-0523 TaxID=2954511 RepID=UPI003100DC32
MNGCLTIILAIIALIIVIKYPLVIIGIILIVWGIREYKINKQLKAKSKLIPIIIIFGCALSISGCTLAINDAEEKKQIELIEQEEAKRQQELKKQQEELERQKELERQEELERQKELEKQAELERQKELEKQAELERQKELEKQAELERQKELEKQAEQKRQEPVVEQEYFSNCKEMNVVYPNGVPEDHPAYASARDRDKDGWACEK